MKITNMQADIILGQLSTIYTSLTKNNEPVPCVLSAGLAKNIRKMQGELKEYFEEKQKLLQKYQITSDVQINNTPEGKKFLHEFTPLSQENSGVEFHKIKTTFDELCDVLENYSGNMTGDPFALQYICKDEDTEIKEGE